MDSPIKGRKRLACTFCRSGKRACVGREKSTCLGCHEKGLECSLAISTRTLAKNAKRKNSEVDNVSSRCATPLLPLCAIPDQILVSSVEPNNHRQW